jgi:hypothetical protein
MINFRISSIVFAVFISFASLPALGDPLGKAPESKAESKAEAKAESKKDTLKGSQSADGKDSKLFAHPSLPGSEINRHDPLAIYREAGIDREQEKKIRQLAKEFEDGQRVRLALMANLLKDMRNLQLQPDPNEKTALAKQDEINKVQAEMGTERTKLVLNIRNVLDFEQKQRLVQNMKPVARNQAP